MYTYIMYNIYMYSGTSIKDLRNKDTSLIRTLPVVPAA